MQDFTKPQSPDNRNNRSTKNNRNDNNNDSDNTRISEEQALFEAEKAAAFKKAAELEVQITELEKKIIQKEEAFAILKNTAGGSGKLSPAEKARLEAIDAEIQQMEYQLYDLEEEIHELTYPYKETKPKGPRKPIIAFLVTIFLCFTFSSNLLRNHSIATQEFLIGAGIILVYFIVAIKQRGFKALVFNLFAFTCFILLGVFNYLPETSYGYTIRTMQKDLIKSGKADAHKHLFYTKHFSNNPVLENYLGITSETADYYRVEQATDIPPEELTDMAEANDGISATAAISTTDTATALLDPYFIDKKTENAEYAKITLYQVSMDNLYFFKTRFDTVEFEHAASNNSLYNMILFNSVTMNKIFFKNLIFNRPTFSNSIIKNSTIENTKFNNGIFKQTTIQSSSLQMIEFDECVLDTFMVKDSNLSEVTFADSRFTDSNFSNSDLSGTDFTDTTLDNVHFFDSNLANATFEDATIEQIGLSAGTNLSKCDFTDATINSILFLHTNGKFYSFTETTDPNANEQITDAYKELLKVLAQASNLNQASIPGYIAKSLNI